MRPMNLLRLMVASLFAFLLAIQMGCGGGGDTTTGGNAGGTPSFSLTLNPTSLNVQKGASGTMLVTATPQGGFNASISWFHSGLPTSVTPTIGPATAAMTYNLYLAVDSTAQAGTYPFTLTGKSAGVSDATVQGTLVIAGPTPSFSLDLIPSSLTIPKGSTGNTMVAVTTQGGFGGVVAFSLQGAPAGVTGSFTPASSAVSSTLQLSVSNSVAPGTYPFSVQGTASGAPNASATGSLTVTATTQPAFSLTATPSTVTVLKGSAGTSTIGISPAGGFSGTVALSASGQPGGVTVAFSPSSATSSSSATFSVGSSVTTGTYPITINGTASGVSNASTTVSLVVTQPSGGTQITMRPCMQEHDVVLFAVQDGSGSWVPIAGTGGAYAFSLTSGRGTVAITLRNQTQPDNIFTMVLMGSTAELSMQMQDPCPSFQPVSGTYTAGTGNNVAIDVGISGTSNFTATSGSSNPWTARAVMKKPLGDLFAAESMPSGGTLKCILRRDIPLSGSNPSVGGDLNFGAVEAFVPGSAQITLTGLTASGQMLTGICHLWNPGLDVGVVGTTFAFGGGSLPPVAVVPASKLRSGDLQGITATAMPTDYTTSHGTSPMLLSQYWMATPQDVTLNFQSPAMPPTVILAQSAPHPRLRFTSNFAAPYVSGFIFNVVQAQGNSSSRGWQIIMSPGWISSGGSFPVDTPDLTSVAGWNASWDLWPTVNLLWSTVNSGFSTGSTRVDGSRQWTCNYAAEIIP
jgi:hypothetical protein